LKNFLKPSPVRAAKIVEKRREPKIVDLRPDMEISRNLE